MTRWMDKINPDSFKGRAILLIADKIIIGALIAAAFVVYDQWKTNELRRSDALFKKGEYVRNLVPAILDSTLDLPVRGALLGSLVEAEALDPTSTFSLAERVVRSDATKQHSREREKIGVFQAPTALEYQLLYPGLLHLMPRETEAFLDYLRTRGRPPLIDAVSKDKQDVQRVVDEEVAHFWRIFFRASVHVTSDKDLKQLNDDKFLASHLPGLWEVGRPLPFGTSERSTRYGFAKDDWEGRNVKGLRILGAMRTIWDCGSGCDAVTSGPRPSAVSYLRTICTSTGAGENQRQLAEALKRLLKDQLIEQARLLIKACEAA